MTETRPPTWDHLKSQKKPVTVEVPIAFDSEVADELNLAQDQFDEKERLYRVASLKDETTMQMLTRLESEREDARAVLEEVKARAAEVTVTFKFRSLGRTAFEELLRDHPPSDTDKEKAKAKGEDPPNFSFESFPIALVANSCIEPELSIDNVKEMWQSEDWNESELITLFNAAFMVNQTRRVVDLGKGFVKTRSSKQNSRTASRSGSRTRSS